MRIPFLIFATMMFVATPAALADLGDTYSFEDVAFPPPDWSIMSSAFPTWMRTTIDAATGTASALLPFGDPGASQDEWLVYTIDTLGAPLVTLNWNERGEFWEDFGAVHEIRMSTTVADDPAAFDQLLLHMTPGDHGLTTVWQAMSLDLPDLSAHQTVHLAFRYQGVYADSWFIDDVMVDVPILHDLAIFARQPVGPLRSSRDHTFCAFIENHGREPEIFNYWFDVRREGGHTNYDDGVTIVDTGQTVQSCKPVRVGIAGHYFLDARLRDENDQDPDNDTSTVEFEVYGGRQRSLGIVYSNRNDAASVAADADISTWLPQVGHSLSLIRVFTPGDPLHNDMTVVADLFRAAGTMGAWTSGHLDLNLAEEFSNRVNDPPDPFSDRLDRLNELRQGLGSPVDIIQDVTWDTPGESGTLDVGLEFLNDVPPGPKTLYTALVEDDVDVIQADRVLRTLLTSSFGQPLTTTDPADGVTHYQAGIYIDPTWVFDKLRLVTWVMEGDLINFPGEVLDSRTRFLADAISDVGERPATLPAATGLEGVRPNPFNPRTTVAFALANSGTVRVAVYDLKGKLVKVLTDQAYPAGRHEVTWDGRDGHGRSMSSGVYFARLAADGTVDTRRMSLLK